MGWRPHHGPGMGVTGPVRLAKQHPHQPMDTEGEVSLLPHFGRRFAHRGTTAEHQAMNCPLQTLKGDADSLVVGISAHALSSAFWDENSSFAHHFNLDAQAGLVQDHRVPAQLQVTMPMLEAL